MPLSKYYGGHGESVMAEMKEHYGKDKGKKVFYATENKRKAKDNKAVETGPSSKLRRKHGV